VKKFLLIFLFPLFLFGAAGDIKISYKAANNTSWIDAIFAKQNNSILGTDSNGVPRIAMGGTFTDLVSINKATATNPAAPTGTLLHLTAPDATQAVLALDSFALNPVVLGRRANGTSASPTALVSGNGIFSLTGNGYGTSAYSNSNAFISYQAAENWTDSAQGTRILFQATAPGATSQTTVASVYSDGIVIANGAFRVTADVVSTTTGLADITGMTTFTVVSGNTYWARIWLPLQASSTGGWNIKINGTATVTAMRGTGRIFSGAVGSPTLKGWANMAALNSGPAVASGGAEGGWCEIDMTFTATSSGTIIPQFCQNTAVGNSTVQAGGSMITGRY
jgi:hypothetical protein